MAKYKVFGVEMPEFEQPPTKHTWSKVVRSKYGKAEVSAKREECGFVGGYIPKPIVQALKAHAEKSGLPKTLIIAAALKKELLK